MSLLPDPKILKIGWDCSCPSCGKGYLYKNQFSLDLKDQCEVCGFDIKKNDSGDGPAVFLIFILGFALVPIALAVDAAMNWPLWLHATVWGVLALTLTLGSLKPLKAYIIALQFKHRRSDWDG